MNRLAAAFLPAAALALASLGCNLFTPKTPEVPAVPVAPVVKGADEVPEDGDGEEEGAEPDIRNEDLDGDGKPESIVFDGQKLRISGVEATVPELSGEAPTLEIVDFDKKDKQREVAVLDPGIEDDARYHVYVWRAGKITHSSAPAGEMKGDGTMVVAYGNCGESVTQSWGLDGEKVVKKSEKKEGKYDEAMCAACPFVYVQGSKGARFAGEILRYQRGPETYALQNLTLDASDVVAGKVRVRIAERKPETTYLDAIHLQVGDRVILPTICERDRAACAADATMVVIAWGEYRDFVFETGDVAPGTPVELWATGFYVPN